jgi:methyl-accepting chemotaxis protein
MENLSPSASTLVPPLSTENEMRVTDLLKAVNVSYGYIEFDKSGTILFANEIFLGWMGYRADELLGKHHRVFMNAGEANSADYIQFWNELSQGASRKGEFSRVNGTGQEVWLLGSYTPILNDQGQVVKVIKLASNITSVRKR